ncbi:ral guanine nucleotide dissociation stimulator-like [Phyllostomus discolor]|uniref:Ral guanine nucleotide dissociation stimulator-like n=1 Tax=Phyllostomus discolor TaxID=89673 RepID=A0A7E6E3B1_9CHIR|nr:ral guanine nucleotide dissociation stimulator-like [Phyllostomus discolor]
MLHTAIQDYPESHLRKCGHGGGHGWGTLSDGLWLSAFQGHVKYLAKKRKELKVLEEIVLLQQAAQLYSIEPEERFGAWFWALERLSEKESYTLSCQLEPRS